jgi:hypothetical protein
VSAVTRAAGVDLLRAKLRKAKLGAGAILQLVLRRDDSLTATFAYTVRHGIAATRHACTRPDNGRSVRCDFG